MPETVRVVNYELESCYNYIKISYICLCWESTYYISCQFLVENVLCMNCELLIT